MTTCAKLGRIFVKHSTEYKILLTLFILAVIGFYAVTVIDRDKEVIIQWMENKNMQAVDVDYSAYDIGPYHYRKGCRVYRVTTDKDVYWFRFGRYFMPNEIYKKINGEYEKIDW